MHEPQPWDSRRNERARVRVSPLCCMPFTLVCPFDLIGGSEAGEAPSLAAHYASVDARAHTNALVYLVASVLLRVGQYAAKLSVLCIIRIILYYVLIQVVLFPP